MKDDSIEPLSPALRALLDTERDAPAPDPALFARIAERVAVTVAAPPVAGPSASSAASGSTLGAKWTALAMGLAAVGLGVAAWRFSSDEPVTAAPAATAPPEDAGATGEADGAGAHSALDKPRPVAAPSAPLAPAPVAAGPMVSAPIPAPTGPAAPANTTRTEPREIAGDGARGAERRDLAETVDRPATPKRSERDLVARVRQTLERDPAGALRQLRELSRAHPRGLFGEERDRLRMVALMRLGRRAEAQTAARRFLAAHPGSVHRPFAESVLTSP